LKARQLTKKADRRNLQAAQDAKQRIFKEATKYLRQVAKLQNPTVARQPSMAGHPIVAGHPRLARHSTLVKHPTLAKNGVYAKWQNI
jgi:hypothetical protein